MIAVLKSTKFGCCQSEFIVKIMNMETYIKPFFNILNEMSPYLLLGFLIAGVLHSFVPQKIYQQHFSKNNFKSVLYSTLFGIPLPLCSCGVIPTAMSLRKNNASKGATVSFLIATPQTGVDSILATASLMGIPFAIIRPFAALFTALVGGTLVNIFNKNEEEKENLVDINSRSEKKDFKTRCIEALHYGFVEMMQDIGKYLIIGLLIAGLITLFVPDDFFTLLAEYPLANMLLILLFALPMYLCATGSIPIAAALMLKGLSPGAAFVLLMAGPATNMASILIVRKVLERKTLILYLTSIIIGAIVFGLTIDYLLPAEWFSNTFATSKITSCKNDTEWWKIASSLLFIGLIIHAFIKKKHTNKMEIEEKNCNTLLKFKIEGMKCNHCKNNVEMNLKKIANITSVEIELEKGIAYINGDVQKETIIAEVEKLGYDCHYID